MTRWLAIVLLLAAAGCSSTAQQPAGPAASNVRIGLLEWDIASSAPTLAPGAVTLEVTNAGATAHDLAVSGEHVDERVRLLAPGERARLQLDLSGEREVELWCTVPGHRQQGMQRRLAVDR